MQVKYKKESEKFKQLNDQEATARDEKLKNALRRILDASAYQRASLIKISNEELYYAIANTLLQYAALGKLKSKVNENELKAIAASLSQKKETKITRISK